jgi:tetratricopeptide (TPR) repeat protein
MIDRVMRCLVITAVVSGLAVVLFPILFESPRSISIAAILSAMEDRSSALPQLLEQHLKAYPNDPFGLYLSAEAAAFRFDHDVAAAFYRKLPRDNGPWQLLSELGIAHRCRVLGKMLEEEMHLRNVLRLDPTHSDANHRLGHLLQVQGRTWESTEPFMMQIRRGKCRGDELMGVTATERFFRDDDELERAGLAASDAAAALGRARLLIFENNNEEGEALLRKVVAGAPHLGEAQGRLGRLIVERGQIDEFMKWRAALPEAARRHPEVWFVQGLQSRRMGQTEGAIHCFLQTVTLSPNHLPANLQIAGCLELVGRPEAARVFQRKAELLSELEAMLNVMRGTVDGEMMLKAANQLAQLGRYWEAAGWTYVMSQLELTDDSALASGRKWASLAKMDVQQNFGHRELLKSLDLDNFAEPNWGALMPANSRHLADDPPQRREADVDWKLADEAEQAGIGITYFEGTNEENRLQHIFNVVGGGVAAVDLDLDGWPDLHIAQANDWRNQQPQPWMDGLFRNVRGQRFAEVGALANLREPGFSHGVVAGDFDQDCFPDVYVCNLGENRFFHNNGDGTYTDVTAAADVAGNEWSIGGVMEDVSGDGLPDLYVGNYSNLQETAAKECHSSSGDLMACTPDVLTAESDRLYLNLGDGTFKDITDASGIRESSGRALGIIAWDFTGNGRISLFVANDTSANFLFHNIETDSDGVPQFREEGVLRGVAFDADGNAQASMGVAAGDVNNDGRIDLFVTNFQHESNTFYTQGADGSFYDFTRQFNLRDSSFSMLGFGTQFADVDGDGWVDIVAVNGHVDQIGDAAQSDKMRPQLFRNLHGEGFAEISPKSLGAFFEKRFLGRAIATLDWNRDGRMDFAMSHIHAPFSLVTNRTAWENQSVVIRLIGRRGAREATGAKVLAKVAGREIFRLVVAGDGFLVSNERSSVIPLPAGQPIEELEVKWPGGDVEKWFNLAAGNEVVLMEGRRTPFVVQLLESRADSPPDNGR